MNIPRFWSKVDATVEMEDGRTLPVSAWGWGVDSPSAKELARTRLEKLTERIRRGEGFPNGYEYGKRPVREEILETIEQDSNDDPAAIITRNRYGALVLNTSTLLFLDVDLPPQSGIKKIFRYFGLKAGESDEDVLKRLRSALFRYRRATFRLYKTAAGYRAIAIDKQYDPTGQETAELMSIVGADPAFARLCKAQNSFRARLTPKPWRCNLALPPGHHPRTSIELKQQFADWLAGYEVTTKGYGTCRYLDTIGTGKASSEAAELISIHDRMTEAAAELPLA